MIISGLQTGDTRWLAAHLQNATDNETIELAEVTGTVASDIDGALAEFDAITAGTRATEGVYAAFINPPVPLSRAQYMRAIALLEERLGLAGQPRIILFHAKQGREHCHIVWSRIDLDRMKAIHLSHDRQKLRRCAQELAAEFGTRLPPGLAQDRGADRFAAPQQPTRAEKAQMKNSGITPEDRHAAITQAWRMSDSAESFVSALEAFGYMLARGDRRCFVVVDIAGDVHSLARQIDGARTSDVRKKLEGLTLSLLPPAERAKVLMLQRAAAQQDAARVDQKKKAQAKAERERVQAVQRKRRAALDLLWQKMKIRQMHEWKVLLAHIKAEKERKIARRHWLAVGLAIYLKKIAFIRQLIEYYEKRKKRSLEEQHQALMESVRHRHENEAAELRRRYDALTRLERREDATFNQKFGGYTDTDNLAHRSGGRSAYLIHGPSVAGQTVLISHEGATVAGGRFGPDWNFRENAFDVTGPPAVSFIAAVRENTADIVGEVGAPHEPVDSVATAVPATMEGYGLNWMSFRLNAAEITSPVAADPVTDEDREERRTESATPRFTYPAWPGAG